MSISPKKAVLLSSAVAWGLSMLAARPASGEERRVVAPGGGLPALSVEVDLKAGVLRSRTCAHGSPCDGAPREIPLELAQAELPPAKDVVIDAIAIGEGKHVAHVRVPSTTDGGVAFEAILAANEGPPLFAGKTGYYRGAPGEREGARVTISDRGNGTRIVLVSRISEAQRQCGDAETLDAPMGLEPKSLELRRATLRLPKEAREAASPIVASRAADGSPPPLVSPLFAATGSGGAAAALVDSDPRTAWLETRPNDGRGEFVTTRALANVGLERLRVVVAPEPLPEGYAAPRVFFVKVTGKTFAVTLPEDAALHPGAAYDVPLPAPLFTECLSVVLDEAYARSEAPNVGLAEVMAYTRYDRPGASLADVVAALSGPDADARESAKSLLGRAGKPGLAAVEQAYPKLDADGRMAALDVTMSALSCADAGDLLVRGYLDPAPAVREHGERRLERCGRAAGPALARAWEKAHGADAARLADLLATLAPDVATAPLGARLGAGSAAERAATRAAFATAARSARPETLATILGALASEDARTEFFRATAPRAADLDAASVRALTDLATRGDFRAKWLLLPAFAALAEKGDAGARAWLAERLTAEKEWPLRARSAELMPRTKESDALLARACADESPRVREAVLRREGEADALSTCAAAGLARDPWPFVRGAAARSLARAKGSAELDAALGRALADPSTEVRIAAVDALGARRAVSQSSALLARLADGKEDSLVRAAAARALGASCARDALPPLSALAKDAALPQGSGQDIAVAMAAVEALGAIHPTDLRARLEPLLAKGAPIQARTGALRAIAAETTCR